MAYGYDIRPNLEGYDALTVRGIAKFVALVAVLIGAQFIADHYGADRWLKVAVALVWIAAGLKVIWVGIRAWSSGDYPPGTPEGPRYADTTTTIRFVSPRTAALGEIAAGLFIAADGAFRLTQIYSGAL